MSPEQSNQEIAPKLNPRTRAITELWENEFFQVCHGKHVRIDENQLKILALSISELRLAIPDWQMPGVLPKDSLALASYLPYICAVNFTFTDPHAPHLRFKVVDETGVYYGSQAMCRCFYRHFGERPIETEAMMNIIRSKNGINRFFQGHCPMPLIGYRGIYLLETAEALERVFNSEWQSLFQEGGYRAFGNESRIGIVDLIELNFPKSFGLDCSYHEDELGRYPLRFAKRAQLWLMIYQGRALSAPQDLKSLVDGNLLGPIADSAIPNALRSRGAIIYSQKLAARIDRQEELPAKSEEVREIRMATISAVKNLLAFLNTHLIGCGKKPVSMLALDNALWQMGRNLKTPAHLCRTTDY